MTSDPKDGKIRKIDGLVSQARPRKVAAAHEDVILLAALQRGLERDGQGG